MGTEEHHLGTTLTFEDQRHKRNHRRFHLGDHFSVAFVVPAGVLAFRRRGIKGQIGPGYPKDTPHFLPHPPALAERGVKGGASLGGAGEGLQSGRGVLGKSFPGKIGEQSPSMVGREGGS